VLIDLGGIAELAGIEETNEGVVVGAMTKHAEVAVNDVVVRKIPGLASMASGIGDRMVRNMGTIGGSLANNDPAADYPAALLALNASVITTRRSIAADEFLLGMFETALERSEIITSVQFKAPKIAAYVKFRQPASRFAIVGVFVAKFADEVRVAVAGAGSVAFRVPEFEAALAEVYAADAVEGLRVDAELLNSDMHASAAYRASLVPVIAGRAVAASLLE
jgi:carbon-monoxide dehydrogenase medium subunit